jgi:hypothetical protein
MGFMGKICYFKGLYKVKVLARSEGYWIVEAIEDLQDFISYGKVTIKSGEKSIVLPTDLHTKKTGNKS